MKLSTNALLTIGLTLLVGACSPFYPKPHPNQPPVTPTGQQTLTAEEQRMINESRGLDAQGQPLNAVGIDNTALTPSGMDTAGAPVPTVNPNTGKKNYPTASPVPGKPGFVFNPFTHNIVDVKGIASGKLCRDPEDADATHKFRVP